MISVRMSCASSFSPIQKFEVLNLFIKTKTKMLRLFCFVRVGCGFIFTLHFLYSFYVWHKFSCLIYIFFHFPTKNSTQTLSLLLLFFLTKICHRIHFQWKWKWQKGVLIFCIETYFFESWNWKLSTGRKAKPIFW